MNGLRGKFQNHCSSTCSTGFTDLFNFSSFNSMAKIDSTKKWNYLIKKNWQIDNWVQNVDHQYLGCGKPVVELKAGKSRYPTSSAILSNSPWYQDIPSFLLCKSSAKICEDIKPLDKCSENIRIKLICTSTVSLEYIRIRWLEKALATLKPWHTMYVFPITHLLKFMN